MPDYSPEVAHVRQKQDIVKYLHFNKIIPIEALTKIASVGIILFNFISILPNFEVNLLSSNIAKQ
jgi:hypothetical protein